jgi:FkbM family methyltransferase
MINIEYICQVGYLKWSSRYFIRQFKKRVLKQGVTLKLPTGLKYYAPVWDPSGTEVYVTNANTDWGAEKLFASLLDKEGTFIDVGAHTGYYSLYMLPLVSAVYAFEPDEQSFSILANYQKQYANFFAFRQAVSKHKGIMNSHTKGMGYSFIENTAADSFSPIKTKEIEVIKIDDYLNDYKSFVTGIKIDVDGPDLDVLEGALATIKKYQPIVLTELSSKETQRLYDICNNINYTMFAFVKRASKQPYLIRLSIDNINKQKVKMIFLVPANKKERFVGLTK